MRQSMYFAMHWRLIRRLVLKQAILRAVNVMLVGAQRAGAAEGPRGVDRVVGVARKILGVRMLLELGAATVLSCSSCGG